MWRARRETPHLWLRHSLSLRRCETKAIGSGPGDAPTAQSTTIGAAVCEAGTCGDRDLAQAVAALAQIKEERIFLLVVVYI